MRVLAIKWRRLGDTVLWTSALEALLQHYKGAQVDIAFAAEYAALFAADRRFQNRFPLSDDASRWIPHWREQGYDLVLVFHASHRSLRLGRAARGKQLLVHHHSRVPRPFGSQIRIQDLGKVMGATERDVNVLRTLGWKNPAPSTHLEISDTWMSGAYDKWKQLSGSTESPIAVAPGASRKSKIWPLEHYVGVIEKLGAPVALIAQDLEEWKRYDALARAVRNRAFYFPTPTLEEALGLLSIARCFVGSDSGLKHAAIALDTPTVTLFGPESVGEWHPYSLSQHPVLQKAVLCRTNHPEDPHFAWCDAEVCPLGSHACLNLITTDEVVEKIRPFL